LRSAARQHRAGGMARHPPGLGVGSSGASSRDPDTATHRIPLVLGQHQGFVGVVPTGDHDEMRAIEVDVALQAVVGVPSDLTVAADDGDESIMRSGVCPGVVQSACFCHPRPPCGEVAERLGRTKLYRWRPLVYRISVAAT
jgi:hypothetical protein